MTLHTVLIYILLIIRS